MSTRQTSQNVTVDSGDAQLFVPGRAQATAKIQATALRVGMRLSQDLFDEDDVLLLAAGTRISPQFLYQLHERGIHDLVVKQESDILSLRRSSPSEVVQELDDLLVEQIHHQDKLPRSGRKRRPKLPLSTLAEYAKYGLHQHFSAKSMLADIAGQLQTGRRFSHARLEAVVLDFTNMVSLDADLLPLIVGVQRASDDYLFDHCVNVSMVSMAIAAQLGLNADRIKDVGLGGLLADIGMLRVPESIRLAQRPLTRDEQLEILQHPTYTVDLLENITGLPVQAKFIGYQTHERIDGSGYPRQRSGLLIHQYAKIVAIADAYVAMTEPRPYREPVTPYHAAKQILLDNSRNKFDRSIVRAFLDCMSLFPIGSTVKLSDGRDCVVIRAVPGMHTKPLVAVLDEAGVATNEHVDLAIRTDLQVVNVGRAPVSSEKSPIIIP